LGLCYYKVNLGLIFECIREVAKSDYKFVMSVRLSIRPYGTIRPMELD